MNWNIISRSHGWYLAKITASLKSPKNIVAVDPAIMKDYELLPGKRIKICSLMGKHSKEKFTDKFMLLPFYRELVKNYTILKEVSKALGANKYRIIDENYLKNLKTLMKYFNDSNKIKTRTLELEELLEFDEDNKEDFNIALPSSWLNEHGVDLGETVLFRNDEPSPIIL
ncbi:MAG: hypothetical protein ACTSU4_08600 [Promethearchaeota archaeon]